MLIVALAAGVALRDDEVGNRNVVLAHGRDRTPREKFSIVRVRGHEEYRLAREARNIQSARRSFKSGGCRRDGGAQDELGEQQLSCRWHFRSNNLWLRSAN